MFQLFSDFSLFYLSLCISVRPFNVLLFSQYSTLYVSLVFIAFPSFRIILHRFSMFELNRLFSGKKGSFRENNFSIHSFGGTTIDKNCIHKTRLFREKKPFVTIANFFLKKAKKFGIWTEVNTTSLRKNEECTDLKNFLRIQINLFRGFRIKKFSKAWNK